MSSELRRDALTDEWVGIAGSRQDRPNPPAEECPFCVGGIEAPEPYEVKAFANRWPMFAPEGYKAFVNHNKKDIDAGKFTLVVADTLKMQLELLRDGYSNALTGQRPFEMGEKAMDTLLAIKKGQKVPETIYTGLDLVTKDNVAKLLH